MNKSPAFQFYIKDWLSSQKVMRMKPAQRGVYIHLLAMDWDSNGLEDNDTIIAEICGDEQGWLNGDYKLVRSCFIPHPDKPGFITNERLQIERVKQAEWRRKSSEGGRKSAESRFGPTVNNDSKGASTTVQPGRSENGSTLPLLSSSSSASSKVRPKVLTPEQFLQFETFWKAYPKKHGKADARKAWLKMMPEPELVTRMLKALEWQRNSDSWTKEGGQFIPLGATWLNGARWEDEPLPFPVQGLKTPRNGSQAPRTSAEDPMLRPLKEDLFLNENNHANGDMNHA